MRIFRILITAVLTAGLGLAALPAAAQVQGGYWGGGGNRLPPGNYVQSCTNISVAQGLLFADCTNRDRIPIRSQLRYVACQGDIENRNGVLMCPGATGTVIGQGSGYPGDPGFGGPGFGGGNQAGLPPGTWLNSCRNARMQSSIVTAECRNRRGQYHFTQFNAAYCDGQGLENYFGDLRCINDIRGPGSPGNPGGVYPPIAPPIGGPGELQPDGFPNGPWRQSCVMPSIRGQFFSARCRNQNGVYQLSTIDNSQCNANGVLNNFGVLRCNNFGTGGGSEANTGSIKFYGLPNFRGQNVLVSRANSNLSSIGFNDRANSMIVTGTWEVCVDSNYRNCRRYSDARVSNLPGAGLGNRISSVRPVSPY